MANQTRQSVKAEERVERQPAETVHRPNLIVVTGGPGAGKTTLLTELMRRGYVCLREVARQIIREQADSGGNAVPWGDTTRYAALILRGSVESFLQHSVPGPAFVDRGIPDVLCYARLIQLADTRDIREACERYRYHQRVFMAPPWREIYATDTERKQTWEEAVAVHETMVETYRDCGYELIELARATVAARADFVLEQLEGQRDDRL